jgi:hypothetical protein
MQRHVGQISLLALTFALAAGCGGQLVPTDGVDPTDHVIVDDDPVTPTSLLPDGLDRPTLNLVREAIALGLSEGKDLVAEGIGAELARAGIEYEYVGGEALTEIPDDVVSECPFVENAGNDSATSVSCRLLAEQARDHAYVLEADAVASIALGAEFDADRELHESWLRSGLASGIDGEYLMAVRRLREARVCDQEPTSVQSSREAGVAIGRRVMEQALEAQLAVTPITECDIDNGIVAPALDTALARIPGALGESPLCPGFEPSDMDARAAFSQARNEYDRGVRQGVEEGAVIASEQLFRTWVCQTPEEVGGGDAGGGGGDPLVLDLDGDGVRVTGPARGVTFALGQSQLRRTGWIADPDDGLLAIDHDGNGRIDNGTELLGDMSWTADGLTERNGLLSLARYDRFDLGGNGDGLIDARDAVFGALRVWRDRNLDGRTDAGELATMTDAGVESVALDYAAGAGTLESSFVREDGSESAAVDVWFRYL